MSRNENYRKPRNKELRDLTWSLPYALRITNEKGKLLWQNRAAEDLDEATEWSQTPTTWQNKKALLQLPLATDSETLDQLDDLESELEQKKRQQRDTARKKRQAEKEQKSALRELEALQKKQDRLEERLVELEKENRALAGQKKPVPPPPPAEVAEQAHKVEQLQGTIEELERKLKKLVEQNSAESSTVKRLKGTVSELESKLRQAEEEARSRLSDSQRASELQSTVRELEEKLAQSVNAEQVSELEGTVSRLEAELRTAEEKVAESRSQSEKIEQLEGTVAELETRLAEATDQQDELKALQAKVASLEEDKTAAEIWAEELEQGRDKQDRELEKAREEVSRLEKELESASAPSEIDVSQLEKDLEQTRQSESRLRERLKVLEELKETRDSVMQSLRDELKESRSRERELRETIALYSDVRREAEKSRQEAKALKLQVAELEDRQRHLKEELLSARERLLSGGGQSQSSGESLSGAAKSQVDFLAKRLKETEQKLDQAHARLKEEQALTQSSKESERLAFQDALTGLPNVNMIRRYLSYARQQALTGGRAIALFLIDLDGFRVFNTTYGREWGDELLKAVGERLNGMRGGSHLVARHSMDRFMLLAADLEKAQLKSFLEGASRSLIEALSYPFEVKGEQIKVTGTIGISLGPAPEENHDTLYRQAEIALEAAKRDGPGRFVTFDDGLKQSLNQEATYQKQMAYAIERDEFSAVYQPVYSMTQKCIMGLELLLRWEHRDQTILKPSAFLAPAIKSGLILKITERLWPRAFAQFARWQTLRKGLTLSINLCDKELLNPALLEKTVEQVRRAGVDPSAIIFEVRDQSSLRMSPTWWEVLQRYSQAGFGLCLDDYGSDSSLFGTLAFHGFRQAKVLIDERAPGLSLATQARRDIEYCAKGVQTKFDAKLLSKAGFHLAQGYAVSRPLDSEDVDGFLA